MALLIQASGGWIRASGRLDPSFYTHGMRPAPAAVAVTSWANDRYSGGAYTHIPPGADPGDADVLGEPIGGRLLFAGEHTQSTRLAYADGAMTSGIREAKRLLGQPSIRLGPIR